MTGFKRGTNYNRRMAAPASAASVIAAAITDELVQRTFSSGDCQDCGKPLAAAGHNDCVEPEDAVPNDTGRLPGCPCGLTGPATAPEVATPRSQMPASRRLTGYQEVGKLALVRVCSSAVEHPLGMRGVRGSSPFRSTGNLGDKLPRDLVR